MKRRSLVLAEMGLAPVWRLRLPAAPAAHPAEKSTAPRPGSVVEKRAAEGGDEAQIRRAAIARMEWPGLKESVAGCEACKLCRSRTHTVFGVGAERADVMIIGEAPGHEEDMRGEPFVGQAGRLLDNMLRAVDLGRDRDVYIANVLKCRPPQNRNPEPLEVERCRPYLIRQIELVAPKLIVAMGRFAAQTLLETDASIASLRGRLFRYQDLPLVVTYHPAYLLRTLADKAKAWEDLLFMRRHLAALRARDAANPG